MSYFWHSKQNCCVFINYSLCSRHSLSKKIPPSHDYESGITNKPTGCAHSGVCVFIKHLTRQQNRPERPVSPESQLLHNQAWRTRTPPPRDKGRLQSCACFRRWTSGTLTRTCHMQTAPSGTATTRTKRLTRCEKMESRDTLRSQVRSRPNSDGGTQSRCQPDWTIYSVLSQKNW